MRDFSGFHLDKKSSEFAQKVSEVKQKVQLPDLIAISSILDLDYSGSSEEVVVRICSFMNDLQSHGENEMTDDEEVEEESEEEVDSDEDKNGNDRGAKSGESFGNTKLKEVNICEKIVKRTCFNCGDKGHLSNECPDKAKGPKCFVCSGYGYVSTKCPEKNNRSGSSNMTLVEVVPRNSVKLNIDDIHSSLSDTGSDITAIRQDVYEAYFKDIDLNGESVTLRGIGSNRVATIGFFERNVFINEEELVLKIHVIPCETSNFKAIVGNYILAQVDVVFRDGEIVVFKKERHNFLWTITLDEEANKETEIVDVIHIKHEENRKEVKKLKKIYPEKIMENEDYIEE
ncbi:hypothetical protein JTB14_007553 [Gonioctena quinquepunctata]|nr:hypothetical protein JTB14_007553 [Gonioctena quinquepunctata]